MLTTGRAYVTLRIRKNQTGLAISNRDIKFRRNNPSIQRSLQHALDSNHYGNVVTMTTQDANLNGLVSISINVLLRQIGNVHYVIFRAYDQSNSLIDHIQTYHQLLKSF